MDARTITLPLIVTREGECIRYTRGRDVVSPLTVVWMWKVDGQMIGGASETDDYRIRGF